MNEQSWISVKDLLPDFGQSVLVFGEDKAVRVGHVWETGKWRIAGFPDDWPFVTHWQPLPDPPPKPDAFKEWMQQHIMDDAVRSFTEPLLRKVFEAGAASEREKGKQ